eukprot:11785904-Heterocapsa_arctica.AAC.1
MLLARSVTLRACLIQYRATFVACHGGVRSGQLEAIGGVRSGQLGAIGGVLSLDNPIFLFWSVRVVSFCFSTWRRLSLATG